ISQARAFRFLEVHEVGRLSRRGLSFGLLGCWSPVIAGQALGGKAQASTRFRRTIGILCHSDLTLLLQWTRRAASVSARCAIGGAPLSSGVGPCAESTMKIFFKAWCRGIGVFGIYLCFSI